MSREEKLALFEKSVPMADAWEVFASPENRKAFANAKGGLAALSEFAESGDYTEGASAVFGAFNVAISEAQKRNNIIDKMKEDILDKLYDEDLVALGIRTRPSKGCYPVEIDAAFFDYAEADWQKSTLEGLGRLYADVRIYDPRAVAAINPAKQRKGSVDIIEGAIADLKASMPDFCNLPRKSACEMIRGKLGKTEISGNGLSDKNLSKRITANCGRRGISK